MADPVPPAAAAAPAPGSPAWWAARPAPAPPQRRRGRPSRSLDEILAVATELIDEVGGDGFNMRLLAERLNTSTATLYRHFTGRDELLAHVVDRLLGQVGASVDREAPAPTTGREALQALGNGYRSFLSAHPNVLPLLVAQLPVGPNALAIRERAIAALTRFGFSQQLAARAFTTLLQYVVGAALTQPGSPGPAESAVIRDYYRSLDAGTYPHVVAAAEALTSAAPDDEFRAGLEIVLDGIDRALPPRRDGATAAR
jgi:AcrR family transcriptional regulator